MISTFRRFPFVVNAVSRRFSALAQPVADARTAQILRVSEIFTSVQGEGPNAGRPSVFLRLGICNLTCNWCDTPYTWLYNDSVLQKVKERAAQANAPSHSSTFNKKEELLRRTVVDVQNDIMQRASKGVRAVVVTGGEPFLHKKPLLTLVPSLLDAGFAIEFETNGTIDPEGIPRGVHLNVSPKLSNSLVPRETRLKFATLEKYLAFPSSILKFVVENERDMEEIDEIVSKLGVHPSRIYLMSQGTTSEAVRERGRWLVDKCLENGFNYSHRIHVELWGDKRGV